MSRSGFIDFFLCVFRTGVLIPLLVDVPLWVKFFNYEIILQSLNPSFSGCPALGSEELFELDELEVLIPLLVDVPLWDFKPLLKTFIMKVLIPLLVDVPLWELTSVL